MSDIEEFIVDAGAADTEAQLNGAFLKALMARGYHSFDAFSHPMNSDARRPHARRPHEGTILTASYDLGIIEPYLKDGMTELCPALQRIATVFTPFDYVEFLRRTPVNRSVKWQLRALALYGVKRAWCVPLSTVGMLQCVTVYMRGRSSRLIETFNATRDDVALLSQHYMEALLAFRDRRGEAGASESAPRDLLTSREVDCLTWVRGGKSNLEIAGILDISENTVRFHMKNVLRKLDVSNRGRAVAKAEALDLLRSVHPDVVAARG